MRIEDASPARYLFRLDEQQLDLSGVIGCQFQLRFTGHIACIHCSRNIKKTFNQGYCFPCMRRLAQCDTCIVRPDLCHFAAGTCRDPEWAQTHCMQPHVVYLAITSGIKVGITRMTQIPTRWLDQGATQALPIAQVTTRRDSGLLEHACRELVADQTDWRAMLKGSKTDHDPQSVVATVVNHLKDKIPTLPLDGPVTWMNESWRMFEYPLPHPPPKLKTWDLHKNPILSSRLLGIKGQYWVFEQGVMNIRKYQGYEVEIEYG
ncbi:MAG: DUF2797 domain-containing protein [Acidobacteria bacterium]|nr:DUF2797 domain-containing protein [Acidobacteriota bacterium]